MEWAWSPTPFPLGWCKATWRGILEVISDIFSTEEASQYVKYSVPTLALWRLQGRGPTYIHIGRSVRYRKSDLDAWLAAHTVAPEGGAV